MGVCFQRLSQNNNQLTIGRALVGVIVTSMFMTEKIKWVSACW
jgi:inner membrane protein involved in colicin E2 resistance